MTIKCRICGKVNEWISPLEGSQLSEVRKRNHDIIYAACLDHLKNEHDATYSMIATGSFEILSREKV